MLRGKPRYELFNSQQRTLANFHLSNLYANKETAEDKWFSTIFLVLAALFEDSQHCAVGGRVAEKSGRDLAAGPGRGRSEITVTLTVIRP
jgi:hypothetical protein